MCEISFFAQYMFKENQTCSNIIEHIGFMEPAWPDFIWLSESQAKIGVPKILRKL